MHIQNGQLSVARQIYTPNHDSRPVDGASNINLLVIHCISLPAGHYGTPYVEALFTNQLDPAIHADFADLAEVEVSSHLFIPRTGEILQFVSFDDRAWHAGESTFMGRSRCNDFSIGIELEGTDTDLYTDPQYAMLVQVCECLCAAYAVPFAHIVGHSDISPGRKSDPGSGFDWLRLRAALVERP